LRKLLFLSGILQNNEGRLDQKMFLANQAVDKIVASVKSSATLSVKKTIKKNPHQNQLMGI